MKYIILVVHLFLFNALIAQSIDTKFFDNTDAFLKKYVVDGKVAYSDLKDNKEFNTLLQTVANADFTSMDKVTRKAFLINAYNLLVIKGTVDNYPLASVLEVNGFFKNIKYTVAQQKMTLDKLEKEELLKTYRDGRLHFVLVCGAIGCPPITNFAYRPENLEKQLIQQTELALDNPNFIKINTEKQVAELSQIFKWYASDFGGNKTAVFQFINRFRTERIPNDYKISYYEYDWTLNDQVTQTVAVSGNSANRYVVSAAITKGATELKIFNNLYTQQTGNGETLTDRSTYFTTLISAIYGVTSRFNVGFDARYRRVRNGGIPSSPLEVFTPTETGLSRQGITAFGPKIRWAPYENLPNFSVQSSLTFPTGKNFEGDGNSPFLDWNGTTWWTQFFNDFTLNRNFTLFTEIDLIVEDISFNGGAFRTSTPITVILSYFPTPKTTVYALTNYSPFVQKPYDYFAQAGLGLKHQVTPNFEVELLYNAFTNRFIEQVNGNARTFNIGVRISR